MLLYRELFLATLISAVSIAFADILVQPNFAHQNSIEPNNAQHGSSPVRSASYNEPFPYYEPITEKLYSLLPDQHVIAAHPHAQHGSSLVHSASYNGPFPYYVPITEKWYSLSPHQHVAAAQPQQFTEIHTAQPHTVKSNFVELPRYSDYPWVDLSPPITASRHVSYTKIGGHGYKRPTIIFKYPKSGRRYRRSADTTSTESSKPAITAHADDVAAESTLIGDLLPTFLDFLLPKKQPINTNNKHVTSRQIKRDHAATRPNLFGLYPEKMYGYQAESPDEIQQPLLPSLLVGPYTPKQSDEQLSASIGTVVTEQAEPTLSIPQEKQLDQFYQEALYEDQQNTYKEFDSKLLQLQKGTQVDGTKSPKKASHKTIVFINSLIPTSDKFASISNIFKREPTNAQDRYNSYTLPWVKNLGGAFQIIDELPSVITLPGNKKKTKSFTYNWLDYVPKLEVKVPALTQSWLKKLLFKGKSKHSEDSDSHFGSLDNLNGNSDNYSDDELSSPTQKYSKTICFPSNNNCITYEISDTEDNVKSIYISQAGDD